MARVALTPTIATGPAVTALPVVTMNTGDATNHHNFVMSGNDLLIVLSAGSHTVTLKGAANRLGRSSDKAVNMTAGQVRIFGPLKDLQPWRQSDKKMNVNVSNAGLKIGLIRL